MGQFLPGKSKQYFHVDTSADCGLANWLLPTPLGPNLTKGPLCWWSMSAFLETLTFFPSFARFLRHTVYSQIVNFQYCTKVHQIACALVSKTNMTQITSIASLQ